MICLCLLSSACAQKIEVFSNHEGFNQNTINSICQDNYGFIWFGTPNGLIKYDGYDFASYTNDAQNPNSISNNLIRQLIVDPDGVIWVGTVDGLDVYLPSLERFYKVPIPEKLIVSRITLGSNGLIWLSGQNELYACKIIDAEKGTFEVSENLLLNYPEVNDVGEFVFVDENSVLLGTIRGLYHIEINIINQLSQLRINSINALSEFSNYDISKIVRANNIYWIGTTTGLFKATLEGAQVHIIQKFDNEKRNSKPTPYNIKTIYQDSEGSLWVGTTDEGLFKYIQETDSFINFPFDPKIKNGISSEQINVIFQDNYNVLWIGTAQGGVNKLDLSQKQFVNYGYNPYNDLSISDNLITSILEDAQGRLWVAGWNGSLSRTKNKVDQDNVRSLHFENIDNKIELEKNDRIRVMFQDDRGYIWFGANLSVFVFNPQNNRFKRLEFKTSPDVKIGQECLAISQIGKSRILIGSRQIIILYNPWDQIERSQYPRVEIESVLDLSNQGVNDFLQDSNGNLWFGTNKGLFELVVDDSNQQLSTRPFNSDNAEIELSNTRVFCLYEDIERNLWVGTFAGGLNKVKLDEQGALIDVEHFRKNDILPDDAIYGVIPESDKLLWVSTDMGLLRLDIESNTSEFFDVRDGLPQNNFRQGAYALGKSGYLYFGGLNGLTIFRPDEIHFNAQPPEIIITDLLVNDKKVTIGKEINSRVILEKSISEVDHITLSQKQKSIGLKVAVQHTSLPLKNKVAYKLEGFNDEWIEENTGKTAITYTNLPPGSYTFMVKGANGDGVWSEEIQTLGIEVPPLWYQTWWAYLLFALLIIGIGTGVTVYFIQHEKLKQRLKYEELDKERLKTINQGKFKYFTNLSHEFRTPLTLIAGPLEHVMNNNANVDDRKYLAIIKKNTKRLLSLVDQLITFRRAEQGHINLVLSKNTLGGFIYPIAEAFEDYAIERNINFYYKVSAPNDEIVLDTEKIERIMFNLLSNSFKHTPPGGNIGIESAILIDDDQEQIQIDVIDSGKGIPPEDLENIFDRFYQLGNRKDPISGGGIGLAFCKTMVNLMGGNISVSSVPGRRTCFSVILPSKNSVEESDIGITQKSFVKDWIPLSSEITDINIQASSDSHESKHTILLVENEVDVQTFLKGALSENYIIKVANNGLEALKLVELEEPDLIVSDVMMPEMDGFQLCEKIKGVAERCHIAIVLLTALGENEDMIKGLEFGADDYISKPFSLKHLKLRIDKLIQNKQLLKEHFSKNSVPPPKDLGISVRDKSFLSDIIEAIEKNIADPNFGVQELASEMNLSSAHFYRRLKKLTGQIPNAYLRNFRLQRAAELIKKNEGHNVTEIMYQIGIESKSHFSTSFKKLHGVPPSEFIKSQQSF